MDKTFEIFNLEKAVESVLDILNRNPVLQKLLAKSAELRQLNNLFQSLLPPALAKNCTLAENKREQLSVIVENAGWATKLRYSLPDLLKSLHTQPEFAEVKTIKTIIRTMSQEEPKIKSQLNPQNAKIWEETKQMLKKSPLKKS